MLLPWRERKDDGHKGGEKGAGAGGEGRRARRERATAFTHRVRVIPAPVRGFGKAHKTWPQVSQLGHHSVPHQLSVTSGPAKVGSDERKRGFVLGEPTKKKVRR